MLQSCRFNLAFVHLCVLLLIIKLSEVLYKTKILKVIKKSNIDFYKICHRQKLILKIELWLLRNMKPLKNEGPKYLNLMKFHILSIEASMAKTCENSNVVKMIRITFKVWRKNSIFILVSIYFGIPATSHFSLLRAFSCSFFTFVAPKSKQN